MTPDRRREFERHWPRLSRQLTAFLCSKGLDGPACEDVTQETALRLIKAWDGLTPSAPLWPFVKTIALNLLRDQARRADMERRRPLPEAQPCDDVAEAGLARVELSRVRRAMTELTPAQRSALLSEIGLVPTSDSGSEKMLRLRARKKLSLLMQRLPLVAPLRASRFAELMPWVTGLKQGAHGFACVACLVVGLGTWGLPIAPGDASPPAVSEAVVQEGSFYGAWEDPDGQVRADLTVPVRTPGWLETAAVVRGSSALRGAVPSIGTTRGGKGPSTSPASAGAPGDGRGDRSVPLPSGPAVRPPEPGSVNIHAPVTSPGGGGGGSGGGESLPGIEPEELVGSLVDLEIVL